MADVNPFDASIITFLNHFAGRSWAWDHFVLLAAGNLFRVAGIVPLLWWAWFRDGEGRTKKRDLVAYGMVSCLFSLAFARMLALSLPFRERPLRAPSLHFQTPFGQTNEGLIGWSSFPSDHAAVYVTLAVCLFFISRRAGIFALAWALFVTSLPRVYMGFHYPTDILAGALIGVAFGCLGKVEAFRAGLTRRIMGWHEKYPGPFYAAFFIYTVQLATAFDSLRYVGEYLAVVGKHAFRLLH